MFNLNDLEANIITIQKLFKNRMLKPLPPFSFRPFVNFFQISIDALYSDIYNTYNLISVVARV